MRPKGMPERVDGGFFRDPGFLEILFHQKPDGTHVHGAAIFGQKDRLIRGDEAPSLQVPGQGGDCLILQGDRPILLPLPLPDDEGPVLQIQVAPLKAHELSHPDAGLEKQLQDGKIPGVVAGFIEQGFIFILLQNRRILLLFEWAFDRIRRTAIDD